MAISERALKQVTRARRSRRLILPLLGTLWVLAVGLWLFKLSVLVDAGRQHGINGYTQLVFEALSFDEGRSEFTRWEVFLMHQGQSMRLTAYFLFAATVFLLSLIPLLRLVDELAAKLEGRVPSGGSR
jgi:hypothetical protein